MSDQHKGAVHPDISKAFHDIRDTYQALYMFLDTPEGEEPLFTSDKIMEFLERDLELMRKAEKSCKGCCQARLACE